MTLPDKDEEEASRTMYCAITFVLPSTLVTALSKYHDIDYNDKAIPIIVSFPKHIPLTSNI